MDIQIIIDAYKKYAKYKDKNLIQLMEFSKLARVEEKVRRYMEVLLWTNLISSILGKMTKYTWQMQNYICKWLNWKAVLWGYITIRINGNSF